MHFGQNFNYFHYFFDKTATKFKIATNIALIENRYYLTPIRALATAASDAILMAFSRHCVISIKTYWLLQKGMRMPIHSTMTKSIGPSRKFLPIENNDLCVLQ